MSVSEILPLINEHMRVSEVRMGTRFLTLEGELSEPHKESIHAISSVIKQAGYAPFFEKNTRGVTPAPHRLKIGLFKLRQVKQRYWLNWLLFGFTFVSTTVAGTLMVIGFDNAIYRILAEPLLLLRGLPYSLSIILILGSHELGHYLTCRFFKMQATPPFFIPFLPPFGTMGAVIRMGLTPSRKALIRVGAAGPIVGFIVAVVFAAIGIATAEVGVHHEGMVQFGEPLVFKFLELIFRPELLGDKGILTFLFAPIAPGEPELMMSPLVTAGWLGFLVTSLNLLPLSQLDGGHIAYGVFGKRRKYVAFAIYALMAGAVAYTVFRLRQPSVWVVWAVLTLLLGFRHPPSENEITPLSRSDVIISVVSLLILVLTVMIVPIR